MKTKPNLIKRIAAAKQSIKLAHISEKNVQECLVYLCELIGIKENKRPTKLELLTISNSMRRGFYAMRVNEVKVAFEMAVDGKIGANLSLYGTDLNSTLIAKVLNDYKKSSENIETNKLLAQPEPKSDPTPEQKRSWVNDGIIRNFDHFSESGKLSPNTSWQYIELENRDILKLSKELKKEIAQEATQEYRNLLTDKKKASDDQNIIKELTQALQDVEKEPGFRIFCRNTALKNYFQELKDKNDHISNHLNT